MHCCIPCYYTVHIARPRYIVYFRLTPMQIVRQLDKLDFSNQISIAPKPPSDEGGGFAARRRRRERYLPLSHAARVTIACGRSGRGSDKGSLRALPRQYNYLTNWILSKCHTKFINKIFITVFDGRYMNQNNLSIKLSQKMPVGIITQIMGYANSS